ncbi:hypothetical protein P2318_10685 [Myxococcaceae bacterium GXIMD 01537]
MSRHRAIHRLLTILLLATLVGCRSTPEEPPDAGVEEPPDAGVYDGGYAEFDRGTRKHLPEYDPPAVVQVPPDSEERLRLSFRWPTRGTVLHREEFQLTIHTPTTEGTYACGGLTRLVFTETNIGYGAGAPTTSKTYDTAGDGGTCSVTLTQLNREPGGFIRGHFSGTLPHVSSVQPLPGPLGPPEELRNGTFETRTSPATP